MHRHIHIAMVERERESDRVGWQCTKLRKSVKETPQTRYGNMSQNRGAINSVYRKQTNISSSCKFFTLPNTVPNLTHTQQQQQQRQAYKTEPQRATDKHKSRAGHKTKGKRKKGITCTQRQDNSTYVKRSFGWVCMFFLGESKPGRQQRGLKAVSVFATCARNREKGESWVFVSCLLPKLQLFQS